jgi:hypothetical protein
VRGGKQGSVQFSIIMKRSVRHAIMTPTRLIIAPVRPNAIAIEASEETA